MWLISIFFIAAHLSSLKREIISNNMSQTCKQKWSFPSKTWFLSSASVCFLCCLLVSSASCLRDNVNKANFSLHLPCRISQGDGRCGLELWTQCQWNYSDRSQKWTVWVSQFVDFHMQKFLWEYHPCTDGAPIPKAVDNFWQFLKSLHVSMTCLSCKKAAELQSK